MSAHTPTHQTLVSLAMPAFNVAPFIEEAIRSVQAQTHTDWELIIVDDCSTDDTCLRIEAMASSDPRVKLLRREQNSGGARLPRFEAVRAAQGKYIVYLDADDALRPDYLELLLRRQSETGAPTVFSRLVICDAELRPNGHAIPAEPFDWQQVCEGPALVRHTIGGWRISASGQLLRADILRAYVDEVYAHATDGGFNDEVDFRHLLVRTPSVAFAPADYLYRQQAASVVHDRTPRALGRLQANDLLLAFARQHLGYDPATQQAAYRECLDVVYRMQILSTLGRWGNDERRIIREAYRKLPSMRPTDLKHRILCSSFAALRTVAWAAATYLRLRQR